MAVRLQPGLHQGDGGVDIRGGVIAAGDQSGSLQQRGLVEGKLAEKLILPTLKAGARAQAKSRTEASR